MQDLSADTVLYIILYYIIMTCLHIYNKNLLSQRIKKQ